MRSRAVRARTWGRGTASAGVAGGAWRDGRVATGEDDVVLCGPDAEGHGGRGTPPWRAAVPGRRVSDAGKRAVSRGAQRCDDGAVTSETSPDPQRREQQRPDRARPDAQSTDPQPADPRPTGQATAPRRAVPDVPLIPTRSADDSDTGWGERADDANDDRLLRDVPPHW